jgi:hypothetical protein
MSSKSRSRHGDEPFQGVVVLQHGLLASLDADDTRQVLPITLPSKLRNVTHLYVFDEAAKNIFKNSVLSPLSPVNDETISFYQPQINVTPMEGARKVNILFVGHPFCEAVHINSYLDISKSFDVGCYYKPHPANPCGEGVKEQNWTIVENRNIFPLVDFVVSYPSTLVGEYAAVNIPSIVHPLNLKNEQYIGLTSSIKDKLESLACEKKLTQ